MAAIRSLRRLARAVRVAVRPPGKIGLDRQLFTSPDADGKAAENTVEHQGRTYRLFFLVGYPRSGTNWCGALLNRHPAINIQGEYRFEAIARGFRELCVHPWHAAHYEPLRSAAMACMRESVRRIMAASAPIRPEAAWIGDRTPRVLDILLPGAPHILIVRDPRDVLVSIMHTEFTEPVAHFAPPEFRDRLAPLRRRFAEDPLFFKKNPEALLGDEPFVRHMLTIWRTHMAHDLEALARVESGILDTRVHVVRYELLHADPENQRAALYRFLDLDPALARGLDPESRTTPGFATERPAEFFRKGRPADWPPYFHDEAKRWFKEEAGELLVRLGYEKDSDW